MNFWLQQSIEINDDGIFMIYTTLDIPQIVEWKMPLSSIDPKDAVIKRKYFLQVLCFIIPKLSRLQCLIHEARAAKKPQGTNQILTQSTTPGWRRTMSLLIRVLYHLAFGYGA